LTYEGKPCIKVSRIAHRKAIMSNEENTLFAGSSPAKRTNIVKMKNVLLLLLGSVLLAGCMHGYDVTMVNGMVLTHVSKPRFDKEEGVYKFTDARGKKQTVSAARIVEIAPHTNKKLSVSPP
jgi:hypothetical protein